MNINIELKTQSVEKQKSPQEILDGAELILDRVYSVAAEDQAVSEKIAKIGKYFFEIVSFVHDDEEQNDEKYKSIFSNFLKEFRDFCNNEDYWKNLPDLIPPSQDAIDSITTALEYGKSNLPKDWTEDQVKQEMEKKEAELRGTEKERIREELKNLIPNLNEIFLAGLKTEKRLLS